MGFFATAGRRILSRLAICGCGGGLVVGMAATAVASGPQGFRTVVIDAGHGGIDRGGGPGQVIPEKPYTLDAAERLERALQKRGIHTVMTRAEDVFVPLPERVNIGNAEPDAIFVSLHFNSAPREEAHGYETYYYSPMSFGLATRLHEAQLSSLDTDDRHIRRRGFFVLRRSSIPAVLCEGGYLTNGPESQTILDPAYRERWADNLADAIVAQQRFGDPANLGSQPPVTTEHLVGNYASGSSSARARRFAAAHSSGRRTASRHHSGGSSSSSTRHVAARRKHHHPTTSEERIASATQAA